MLNSRDYQDKHLLRLRAEMQELWGRRYIRVPLAEPLQRGWQRFHILDPQRENRADVKTILTIGTVRYRRTSDFRERRGRGRRRRYVEIEQPLRELTLGEWPRLGWPENWKSYFRHEQCFHYSGWRDRLVFAHPQIFTFKIEPNWVTELTIPDPAVEQRLAEIEQWLWHHNAKYRLDRLCDLRRWVERGRCRVTEKVALRELRQARQNPLEVDPAASMRRRRFSLPRALLPRRSPTSRGTPLRTEPVRVQILPPGPFPLTVTHS